jgi:hypothetical protein
VHDVRIVRGREARGQRRRGRRLIPVGNVERRAVGEHAARVPQRERPVAQRVGVELARRHAVGKGVQHIDRRGRGRLEMPTMQLEMMGGEVHALFPHNAGHRSWCTTYHEASGERDTEMTRRRAARQAGIAHGSRLRTPEIG